MDKNQAEVQAGKKQYGKAMEVEFVPMDLI